jgi:hypothetical protein
MRPFIAGILLSGAVAGAESPKSYFNNFETAEVGSVSEELMVLDGEFTVKEEEGNKFLELPGAPLETFGVLFGSTEKEGTGASARVYGTSKGRLHPVFGVGVNGANGYRLLVVPGKKALELHRGEEVKASVPFEWKSGTWTKLRIQMRKLEDGSWTVEGKAWAEGGEEPKEWTITAKEPAAIPAGRASIWGCPYSSHPIRFDDLKAEPVP